MNIRKKYTLQNPLMFTVVMKDRDRCIGLIERIFPERKVEKLKFIYGTDEKLTEEIEGENKKNILLAEPETERTYIPGVKAKSIRMDVLFENSDTWYDIEMQVYNAGNLPKRSRYYHAAKTVDSLKAGENYNKLKEGYVIFINGFDLFGLDEPIYSFEMFDRNLQLKLNDGQYTIFLNSTCKNNVPIELEGFYRYLQTGEVLTGDDWLCGVADAVDEANAREEVWNQVTLYDEIQMMEGILRDQKREFITLEQEIAVKNQEIAVKNQEIAVKDQEIVDKERVNHLVVFLAKQGRTEDILRSTEDKVYCQSLMEEFKI